MPKPASLPYGLARRTLAHKFTRLADNLRQLETRFGLHSKRVFLVWTRWTGAERGVGDEVEYARCEILPTPRVADLSVINRAAGPHGVFPEGTVRLTQISCGAYTEDNLTGLRIPTPTGGELAGGTVLAPEIADTTSFFYELVEDDRGGGQSQRRRYRLFGSPHREEGALWWQVNIQAASDDLRRDGMSRVGDLDVYGGTG